MEQQARVLIGARSEARGRELEQQLRRDPRISIVGLHTQSESLRRAILAEPNAALLLDTTLGDRTALEVMYAIQLRRPCPVVALTAAHGGDHAYQMIRAGAIDCILWDHTEATALATANALLEASRTRIETLQLVQTRDGGVRSPSVGRPLSSRIVLLVGSRRAPSLCDALAWLPASFSGAVLCSQPVHRSALHPFATRLARSSSLRVLLGARATICDGGAYLFDDSDQLYGDVDGRNLTLRMRRLPHGQSDAATSFDWLARLQPELSAGRLQVVIVSAGYLDPRAISLLSKLLSSGVALARLVQNGYQVRWPQDHQALRFSAKSFWNHLHERFAESAGANLGLEIEIDIYGGGLS